MKTLTKDAPLRYCLYAGPDWVASSYPLKQGTDLGKLIHHSALPKVMHSGLTNWPRVFDGWLGIPATTADYMSLDVIHLNMSNGNIGYIKRIKRQMESLPEDQRPMIVANPDYAIEMWQSLQPIDLFLDDINLADRIFCVHPTMSDTLGMWLNRKVYTIPHPTDVDTLRDVYLPAKKDKYKTPTVLVLAHSYDQNTLVVTETLRRYQARYQPDMRLIMVGHVEHDKMYHKTVYDEVFDMLPFEALMEVVARVDCVIDTAATSSYGRIGVECAALQTPCIANERVASPTLQTDIFNAKSIVSWLKEVFADYRPLLDANRYSYAKSRKAFEGMIYGQA